MKKVLTIIVVVVLVLFLSWQSYIVLHTLSKEELENTTQKEASSIPLLRGDSLRIANFRSRGKSPFVPYKVKPKPKKVVKKKKVIKKKPKVTVKPPRIKITGIMWNPSNPIAMITLPNGSSTTARAGQSLSGGITVKKIEQHRIQVEYKSVSFWIKK